MKAEIISIGTELLLGHVVNTNAAWLGRELAPLGIDLHHVTTVGDNPDRLREALATALGRSDLVLTSGGLGPTKDDLSKEAVAEVTHRPLVLFEECLAQLKEYFGTRPMGESQIRQVMLPDGSTPLANAVGTAPGCAVPADGGKLVVMLPGPPHELEEMFACQVVPLLSARSGTHIVSRMVRTTGLGEGALAERLGSMCDQANPTVATYVGRPGEIYVRLTAKATSPEEAQALLSPAVERIRALLGDVVYGIDIEGVEHEVVALLVERGEELATAESCTGGLVAKLLTDVPGASGVFRTGVVSYANETKERILGVPHAMLERYGAVSPQVARAMAEGIRAESGATYGIGITGVAGPGGGTPAKPVGLVWMALATPDHTYVSAMRPQGRYLGRENVRERSARRALDLLRRFLQGVDVADEDFEGRQDSPAAHGKPTSHPAGQ